MKDKGRALGIDYGDRRVGIAVSDATLTIASPLATLKTHNVFGDLFKIVEEYKVKITIIGKPISMSGRNSNSQLQKVEKFAEKLRTLTDTEIILWDERLSTHASQRYINEARMPRSKQKNIIDKVAASFILQGWLDYQGFLPED